MGHSKAGPNDRSIWRTAGQLAISVEDRFRFTLVVCFLALGFLGSGALFYLSDSRAHRFNQEAARVAVQRWHNRAPNLYEDIFGKNSVEMGNAPAILDSNRLIPRELLPQNLMEAALAQVTQANGEVFWLISNHPLIESDYALVLSEVDYPELKIARESMQFQRWLIGTLLVTLVGAYAALFLFNKHYIFRPLRILREALLSRRLTDVAKFRRSRKSKVVIERLEEKSRFPLEQFDSDEFGQIASILSDNEKKQKSNKLNWTKSFNTIEEPVAVFGADGILRHLNNAMEHFFEDLEISAELTSNMTAETFVSSILQTSEELKEKILRVINQDYPKITAQACVIELPEGPRSYRYSIATMNNNGERFAIISLIRDQSANNIQTIEDIILEHSNVQMKLVHKMKKYLNQQNTPEKDNLLSLCEALVDNMHGLLEESNNASLATHTSRVEFNLSQFLNDLQLSTDHQIGLILNLEKNSPAFIFGYPTHLRQLIKGVVHAFKESNPAKKVQLNVSYNFQKKGLSLSMTGFDTQTVTRNPSLGLFLSHYNPMMSLEYLSDSDLNPNEFVRIFVTAAAAKNQIANIDLKFAGRELPERLILIGDKDEHPELTELLNASSIEKREWFNINQVIDAAKFPADTCALMVSGKNVSLKSKNAQKAINQLRAHNIPLMLVSSSPRRGETITALRLGFLSYLTFPIELNEFNKVLMLTMNKSLREGALTSGLFTKHTVRDLMPSVGNVLIGDFSECCSDTTQALSTQLQSMGYCISTANHIHSFFELLHKKSYEYIICSNEISSGLKRRIQVSNKGTPCLLFGPPSEVDAGKHSDVKSHPSVQGWITIETPVTCESINDAFSAALKSLAARIEGRTASTENKEENETEKNTDLDQLTVAS